MKKYIISFIFNCCLAQSLDAQQEKNTEKLEQVWLAYFNQTRWSKHWGCWLDAQLRTREHLTNHVSSTFVRAGITYYVSNETKLTVGYASLLHFTKLNEKNLAQPEHRFWQQVQWHTNYRKTSLAQWIRLEERYRRKISSNNTLADGYHFNLRFRYNIWYDIALSKKGLVPNKISMVLNNELHINLGKEIVYNYFDQNRFFVGLKYPFSSSTNLQIGYLNVFQQLPLGNQYKSTDAIRISYVQTLDLRSKK